MYLRFKVEPNEKKGIEAQIFCTPALWYSFRVNGLRPEKKWGLNPKALHSTKGSFTELCYMEREGMGGVLECSLMVNGAINKYFLQVSVEVVEDLPVPVFMLADGA